MGITYGDHLIDSGYYDITPEQEREMETQSGALGVKTYPDNGSWGHEMPMTKDQVVVLSGPACASCKKMPVPDCDNPACAFRTTRIPAVVGNVGKQKA